MSIIKANAWQFANGTPVGTVLQVVSAIKTDGQTFSTGAANSNGGSENPTFWEITGLTVSITPKAATSKILILGSVTVGQNGASYQNGLSIVRNGTTRIGNGVNSANGGYGTGSVFRAFDSNATTTMPINFLDSPATTSTLTYGIWCNNNGGSTSWSQINRHNNWQSAASWYGNPSSTIVVMEIAG